MTRQDYPSSSDSMNSSPVLTQPVGIIGAGVAGLAVPAAMTPEGEIVSAVIKSGKDDIPGARAGAGA